MSNGRLRQRQLFAQLTRLGVIEVVACALLVIAMTNRSAVGAFFAHILGGVMLLGFQIVIFAMVQLLRAGAKQSPRARSDR